MKKDQMKGKTIKQLLAIFATPLLMATATSVGATNTMGSDQINARHDAAMKQCENMKGNEKDVCEKEADAKRDAAKADAKAGEKSAEARHDAAEDKSDAAYDVAKEKCDAMSGDAKDQCVEQAKTKFGK